MSRLLLILFIVFGCSKNTLNDVSSDESSIILDYRAYKGNGLSNFYIDHDGLRREFFLYIPNSIGSKKNPVIFNFHGYSGFAQRFFTLTDIVDIAETNGIILVYPQGALLNGVTHWNAGNISTLNKSNVDDLGFFKTMLDEINQEDLIDLKRVYATGYSNGGFFSYFLACNTDNILAAIGDVAGAMLVDTYNTCNPSNPMPVINIHGTYDGVVPYNGNQGYKSVDEIINYWATFNKNFEEPIIESLGEGFEKITYNSDENNTSTVHYKISGGRHTWDYSSNDNLKTSKLLWDFFRSHRRIN